MGERNARAGNRNTVMDWMFVSTPDAFPGFPVSMLACAAPISWMLTFSSLSRLLDPVFSRWRPTTPSTCTYAHTLSRCLCCLLSRSPTNCAISAFLDSDHYSIGASSRLSGSSEPSDPSNRHFLCFSHATLTCTSAPPTLVSLGARNLEAIGRSRPRGGVFSALGAESRREQGGSYLDISRHCRC